jgi:hypothetical protein
MNIYMLLGMLVKAMQPRVESPAILAQFSLMQRTALDLIQELERQAAFGTVATITVGNPYE